MIPLFDPMVTKGGLFLPDQSRERCDQGIVKYIAPDEDLFEVGDYVLFSAYDGTLVEIEGELLIIMKAEVIACKISPPEYLNTPIRNLYFRSDYLIANTVNTIINIINARVDLDLTGVDQEMLRAEILKALVEHNTESFIDANYEQAIEIISQTLTNLRYPHRFRFKNRADTKPKSEELTQYGR